MTPSRVTLHREPDAWEEETKAKQQTAWQVESIGLIADLEERFGVVNSRLANLRHRARRLLRICLEDWRLLPDAKRLGLLATLRRDLLACAGDPGDTVSTIERHIINTGGDLDAAA